MIVHILICIVEAFMNTVFLYHLAPGRTSAQKNTATVIFFVLKSIFFILTENLHTEAGWVNLISVGMDILFTYLMNDVSIAYSAAVGIVPTLLFQIVRSFIEAIVLQLPQGTYLLNYYADINRYISSLVQIIYCFVLLVACNLFERRKWHLKDRELIHIGITFALSLAVMTSYEYVLFYNDTSLRNSFMILLTLVLITNVIILNTVVIEQNRKIVEEEAEIVRHNEIDHYQMRIQEEQQSLYRLKHDIKHYMRLMRAEYNSENDSVNHAAEKVMTALETAPSDIDTISPAVNTVMDSARKRSNEKHIDFRFLYSLSKEIALSDVDLYLLLSNLMDNAIVHNHDGGFIDVSFTEKAGNCLLEVTNSVGEGEKKKNRRHGHGMRTISEIVERYHGMVTWDTKDSTFCIKILLPVKA